MADDDSSGGRSMGQLVQGAEAVRQPQFHVQRASTYQRNTVLDNLYPTTGNGMSELDRQRVMLGVRSSRLGQSDDTFEQRLWLGMPKAADLYRESNS